KAVLAVEAEVPRLGEVTLPVDVDFKESVANDRQVELAPRFLQATRGVIGPYVDHVDPTADVVVRPVAVHRLVLLDRLGQAGLKRGDVGLEAYRVDVGQIVGDDLQSSRLGLRSLGR